MAAGRRRDRRGKVALEVDVHGAGDVAGAPGSASGFRIAELEPAIRDPPAGIGQAVRELARRDERGSQPFLRVLHLTRHGRPRRKNAGHTGRDTGPIAHRAAGDERRARILAPRRRRGARAPALRPPDALSVSARLKKITKGTFTFIGDKGERPLQLRYIRRTWHP